jgi:hypothetical protein
MFFAADTDPVTILSSGNYLVLLAFIIVVLVGVIVYQQKRLDKKDTDISQGFRDRIADNKQNALDYKDMAEKNAGVLSDTSQNMALLGEKIEVVKGQRA